MNCSSCNKELKEGAKFCTSCGTPVQQQTAPVAKGGNCSNCNASLKPGAKFCTSCGTPQSGPSQSNVPQNSAPQSNASQSVSRASTDNSGDTATHSTMSIVKQKIVWNVLPGEVARTIKESEFVEYDNATGLIVDDGTTALIRANGKTIAEINGGTYDFVDPEELDQILNHRTNGAGSSFKKGIKSLINFVFRRKVDSDSSAQSNSNSDSTESMDSIVQSMREGQLITLNLKLDREFTLVIGAQQNELDDYGTFEPMLVKSKYLDLKVGIQAAFKISDFEVFSKHYLSDKDSITTAYLTNELAPVIRVAIEDVLYDVELQGTRIPTDILERIKQNIAIVSGRVLHGITIENILEVSVGEENLERLRAVSRELYLSEQELDFLTRTNTLQNRLNAQVDEQTLFDARREMERDRALMEVNRDGLLSEDEMEKFKLQLQLEKAVREARTNDEYQGVLAEIEASGLQRAHSLNKAKLIAQQELNELNLKHGRDVRVHQVETDVIVQGIKDEYDDGRKKVEDDRNEKLANSAIERLRKMNDLKQQNKAQEHQMQMEREREANEAQLRNIELKAGMSPQQLMAIASEKNMDSAAAQKLAESFSAGLDVQQQKDFMESFNKMNQSRIDDQMANADRMERMMNRMMDMTSSMAGGIGREQEALKNEYRDRLHYQEGRMDSTVDRSLDYATKNNAIDQTAAPAPQSSTLYMVDLEGMESVQQSMAQLQLLIKKGKVSASTFVYSSVSNDWLEANRYSELAHLFIPAPPSKRGVKSCSACGANNAPEDMFCDGCGAKL